MKWQSNEWINDWQHFDGENYKLHNILNMLSWHFSLKFFSFHLRMKEMVNGEWWLVIHPIPFISKNQCHILILMSSFVCMTTQKIFTYSFYYYYGFAEISSTEMYAICRAKSHRMNETWLSFSWPVNIIIGSFECGSFLIINKLKYEWIMYGN